MFDHQKLPIELKHLSCLWNVDFTNRSQNNLRVLVEVPGHTSEQELEDLTKSGGALLKLEHIDMGFCP